MSGASTPCPEVRSASVATSARKEHSVISMKLLEVVLSAAPVREMSFQEKEAQAQEWLARKRRHARRRMYTPVPPSLDLVHYTASMPTPPRVMNRWDHFCRLHGSRDALCAELDDPNADEILYEFRRSAQRPSPIWHAALVQRDLSVLSNAPALWYPVLTTTLTAGFSLPVHAAYTATHAPVLMPPRTPSGKALRAQMHHSDLLGSFHQELLEKVQLEVAPLYRADMALALMFLVVEAFAGEVLPPVYLVHISMQAIVEALGQSVPLVLDQMIPSTAFQDAIFVYLERWVETALIREWREMLGALLSVITPALPVALRLVVDTVLPTASDILKPDESLWQWALPLSFHTIEAPHHGGDRGGDSHWWVTFPTETCRALEATMQSAITAATASVEPPQQSVVEANHFEEVVQWALPHNFIPTDSTAHVIVGRIVRHEDLPMLIRRQGRSSRSVALRNDVDGVAIHEESPNVQCTEQPENVDWNNGPQSAEMLSALPPYAVVGETHWSRSMGLYPLPENDTVLQSAFGALLARGAVAPATDVTLADFGPAYAPFLRGGSPQNSTKQQGSHPTAPDAMDGPWLWDPSPRSAPQHVVSHLVCCADLSMPKNTTIAKLPASMKSTLREYKLSSMWKPRADQQDIVLHYYDGYCNAKVGLSLVSMLRLLCDVNSNAIDALVLFGQLSGGQQLPQPTKASKALVVRGEPSSSTMEALNIQLLPIPVHEEEPPPGLLGHMLHSQQQNHSTDDFSASDDDNDNALSHQPTSFTCDVFSAVTDARLDRLLRPLLITTGGVGVVRYLIQTIKNDVTTQQELLKCRPPASIANNDPLSSSTAAFGYSPELVANKKHIRVVIEAAPAADGWAQSIGGRPSVSVLDQLPPPSGDAGHLAAVSWKPAHFSASGALALELKRLNPAARVQLPLGGLRTLPHKHQDDMQRGKPPDEISFPEAQVTLAVFSDRVRRNRRFLFNAVKSTSPPVSARGSPTNSHPGSPTSSAAFSAGVDMRAAMAQLREGGVVPITNMSLTNVFRIPEGPSPMGLGTLIHGAQGGSALDQLMGHSHKKKGRAMEPTGGSKRQGKKLVPMAESSALQASQRRSMRRSHSPSDSVVADEPVVDINPPRLQRKASYLEGPAVPGQRNATPPVVDDDTETWRTRSKELRSGAESPWTALPPLRNRDTPLRVLAPEAAKRRQELLPPGMMLPVLKPQKRFEKLRKKAQSAPPFF
ncbi:Hypothetical protein, putative [Bodo saltans]|uniref:Uncharacterized protein n=1 Tax=Bodo saltans TaxID=75058 RepID=A0A0S4JC25_BODSA|nr:Hypothetical protein, putative [Bodo saltans]|eukprot:CUG87521.1 Hypothetical protein, putative [Bodo saltans]